MKNSEYCGRVENTFKNLFDQEILISPSFVASLLLTFETEARLNNI
jgi:hypothetical protein